MTRGARLALAAIATLATTAGCGHKSGEHQSVVTLCEHAAVDPLDRLDGKTLDDIQVQLTAWLAAAHFAPCAWPKPRVFQLGAVPVAWFCGTIGDARVEAAIDRPGERGCPIELDLRADVSGSVAAITELERPIIALRDAAGTWFERNARTWWSTPAHVERSASGTAGCCPGVGKSGAWLGDPDELMRRSP